MGKAARWLKSLMGMKRDKETPAPAMVTEKRRRWSFTQPRSDSVQRHRRNSLEVTATAPAPAAGDALWLRSYLSEERDEKHAIAVAAATAAAADAAVAAAQAAMAVVRLTTHGRCAGAGRERWAAFKIQAVFRGYLARKALRALKGLVKLQAHVRGYLVRKRTTATLRGMQALVRAQAAARLHRRSIGHDGLTKLPLETQPRVSSERFDESRSEFHSKRMSAMHEPCYDDNPKIVEIDTYKPKSRPYLRPNYYATEYGDQDYNNPIAHLQYSTISGPITGPVLTPARLSVPSRYEWGQYENEDRQFRHRRTSTAHSTPRFANMNWANGPFTPAKSVCDGEFDGPFGAYRPQQRVSGNYNPNYMASTQSFEAKSRSQSAPRQRPPHPSPSKKRMMPLEKVMESRHSLSGVSMHRSYSEDREAPQF